MVIWDILSISMQIIKLSMNSIRKIWHIQAANVRKFLAPLIMLEQQTTYSLQYMEL